MQQADVSCQHDDNGICRVASRISGADAEVTLGACAACGKQAKPRAENAVTVSLALSAVHNDSSAVARIMAAHRQQIPVVHSEASRAALDEIENGIGAGSQLWRLLSSLGIVHKPTCSCVALAQRMNAIGPAGCRNDREKIVGQIRDNASNYGWGAVAGAAARAVLTGLAWRLDLTDVYGSLVDEAIRLAESELPTDPIDILLPCGPGSRVNDLELRLALRSIRQHAVGLRRVIVLGHVPAWLRETEWLRAVPLPEFRCNKASRISLKVKWAFEHLDLTDRIAFWNDDYLMLRDFDIRAIPNYYRGYLWRTGTDQWSRLLNHTAEVLDAAGLPARHFDIHVPIHYDRQRFLDLSDWWERSRRDKFGLVAKSVYGNNYYRASKVKHNTPTTAHDCKLKRNWQARIDDAAGRRWVISYGDAALLSGLREWMLARFPKPCEAEGKDAKRPAPKRRRRGRRQECCQ